MLPSSRNGSQCIYCAFRAYQLRLESLRLRHHRTFHSTTTSNSRREQAASVIRLYGHPEKERPVNEFRFTGGRAKGSRVIDPEKTFAGKASDDGTVRKFFGRRERLAAALPAEARGKGFESELKRRLEHLKDELKDAPLLEQLRKEKQEAGEKAESFEKVWRGFTAKVVRAERIPFIGEKDDEQQEKVVKDIKDAYTARGVNGLDDRIKYAFYGHLTGARFTASDIKNQQTLADLRYPSEWFPATRSLHRKIHLHVGPTNSGKTYQALQRLEQAQTGVYAGPLRLLAHEVYTRMNANGKACALITGEERRMAPNHTNEFANMSACTVEMMPLNTTLEVAVIDEIQMIGNAERGWAWTQALLGVKAEEVHLCGEERTVPMLREICASLGEKLEIHRYQRLSPLKVADESLDGKLGNLRKGDCIVSFSVMGIHALRRQIERATGRKVATVYGSLPPETRAQQARLFNDPYNDYDYLVASDAVGMGLNLAIKRIIFEASSKFDGSQRRTLGVADIKQIAGRAGRYRIASMKSSQNQEDNVSKEDLSAAKGEASPVPEPENTGLVTTLEKFDFPVVRAAMSSDPEPIRTAGIFPPGPVLERFASYFPPSTPFSYILTRLHELSQMHTRFHLCGLKDQVWIADLIEPVKGLTITDRNIICSSPASKSDVDLWKNLMPAYARCIADQTGGSIYDISELPLEVLEIEASASRDYLRELERLHKGIVTYLWLSYRFAGVFGTRSCAFHVKGIVEGRIEEVLGKFSFSEASRRKLAARREKVLLKEIEALDGEEDAANDAEPGVIDTEEYDGADADAEAETGEQPLRTELQEQTSLTSGGDHFGGEEDLGLEEPEEDEGPPAVVSNFAQWRARETRALTVGNAQTTVTEAAAEGEEEALEAAHRDELDIATQGRPSVEDVDPEAKAEHSPSSSEIISPEQDPSDLEAPITPETEFSDDEPPLETQETAPKPEEARMPDEEAEQQISIPTPKQQDERPGGHNQFGGVPPKHLAHLDVDATEVERDLASRP